MIDMTTRSFVLRFVDNLYRRRFLFVVPAILLGAIGYFLAQGVEQYTSEGTVLVDSETYLASLTDVRSEGFSWLSPSEAANSELYGLLTTDVFIEALVDQAGIEDEIRWPGSSDADFYEGVRTAIWGTPGGDFLTVSAVAGDPETAQVLANATIETFVQWQLDADLEQSQVAEQFVEELVVTYATEVELAQDRLTSWVRLNPGPSRAEDRPVDEQLALTVLQTEVDEASQRYNLAITQREEARLASAQAEADIRQSFSVLDAPSLPEKADQGFLDVLVRTALFATVGLVLSTAVLVFISGADTSLRFPREIEDLLGAELLAVVPKVDVPKVAKQ